MIHTELSAWLKENDMSQRKIAETLDISPAHVSMILSGERRPSSELARRLSEITGISLENLLFPETKDAA